MGLQITRRKDGAIRSKWWYGDFTVDGKRHFTNLGIEIEGAVPASLKEVGNVPFERSRMKAQLKLDELKKEACNQKTAEKHLQELYELKAGEAIDQIAIEEIDDKRFILPARKKRSLGQEKHQLNALKNFRKYIQKNYPAVRHISQITKTMARGWLSSLDEQNFAAKTYNDKLHILRGFFDRIGDEAGVMKNPFAGCQTKIKKTVHRQPFSQTELTKILKHCDALIRPVVLTAMCTAMRQGDCCRLKWESVDLDGGFITVKTSKTGEVAEIPLFPTLRAELEHLPRTSEYVFPEAEEMYRTNTSGITWRFKQALKAAKIENTLAPEKTSVKRANLKDFHSFRTTWITMALSAGVPMELVRRVTGHSTVDVVLKHYFRPGKEAFKSALETAMPKMLTGGQTSEAGDQKSAPVKEACTGQEDGHQKTLKTLRWLLKHGEDLEKAAILRKLAEIESEMAA